MQGASEESKTWEWVDVWAVEDIPEVESTKYRIAASADKKTENAPREGDVEASRSWNPEIEGLLADVWFDEFLAACSEFKNLLWGGDGEVRLDGYRHLVTLADRLRRNEYDEELKGLGSHAQAYKAILYSIYEGKEARVSDEHPEVLERGYVFTADDGEYLKRRLVYFGRRAARMEGRRAALESTLRSYEHSRSYFISGPDYSPGESLWSRPGSAHSVVDRHSAIPDQTRVYRTTKKYLSEAASILRANPRMEYFASLGEQLERVIPYVEGSSMVRNLKRITGYEDDGEGFSDFRRRVLRLAGQLDSGGT